MTDHSVPFQCSASGPTGVLRWKIPPTAVQSVADTHDTPERSLELLCALGDGMIDQTAPSQCSTSVKARHVP
jgi:hypothetical protein